MGVVFEPCYVVQHLVSIRDLQSSFLGKEFWPLYFNCRSMSFDGYCIVSLPHSAVDWSAVCDCDNF